MESISDLFFAPGTIGTTETQASSSELGADAFMRLLIEQLKNQDPTAPVDNQQYIAQLAEFSSLEATQQVNENLVALAALQQENALMSQLTSATSLIGAEVEYADPTTGEAQTGTVDSVRIEGTLAVLNIGGQDVPLANVTEVNGPPTSAGSTSGGEPASTGEPASSEGTGTGA